MHFADPRLERLLYAYLSIYRVSGRDLFLRAYQKAYGIAHSIDPVEHFRVWCANGVMPDYVAGFLLKWEEECLSNINGYNLQEKKKSRKIPVRRA